MYCQKWKKISDILIFTDTVEKMMSWKLSVLTVFEWRLYVNEYVSVIIYLYNRVLNLKDVW